MKNLYTKIKWSYNKVIKSILDQIGKHLYGYFYKVIKRPGHPGGALSRYEIQARIDYYLFLFGIFAVSLIILLIIVILKIIF